MRFDRKNPLMARLKERDLLTKPGSSKETYHIVLDLQGASLPFKAGDSIGILAENDPTQVNDILKTLDAQDNSKLRDFLTRHANLSRVSTALAKKAKVDINPADYEVGDFLKQFTPEITPDELMSFLSPLLPRFYSVASSPLAHPGEVHLTVALSKHHYKGEPRYGVASHFLCHLATIGKTPIPCYVQPALHFTLPQDHATPIIMIGPGTGVAPFRAFLQERLSASAAGKNWLFFGERNRKTDFYYEEFWCSLHAENKLVLDCAFSRDQEEKVYVQHKMLHKAADLWRWIQEGAHIYVCGEADPMAKDVEKAVLQIFQQEGMLTELESRDLIRSLRKQKRYLIDVY